MTKADLINFNLMLELNRVMDRNPDLTLLEVIKLVLNYRGQRKYDYEYGNIHKEQHTKLDIIPNSEMLNLFKKYNDMRDLDAENYRERNAT